MIVSTTSRYSCLACRVEVGEPSEGLGLLQVVGLVHLVELLERVPSNAEPGMSVEQPIQRLLVPFAEMDRPPQEGEPGSEQFGFVYWGTLSGGRRCVPAVPG